MYFSSFENRILLLKLMLGAWSVLHISLLVIKRLNQTESTILFSLVCFLLSKDVSFKIYSIN